MYRKALAQPKSDPEGHLVLLSSTLAHNYTDAAFAHPNARIIVRHMPQAKRLTNYDLVILPYSEFIVGRESVDPYKHVFEKQMIEALANGKTFCFVHQNENVPKADANFMHPHYQWEAQVSYCLESQAGFRWHYERQILIDRTEQPILEAKVKRGEFNTFLRKWGASYNFFTPFERGNIDDMISTIATSATGFALDWDRGMIIYLPFQSNHSDEEDFKESINSLIDTLLTYKAKRIRDLPDWAREPLFEKEKSIEVARATLISELAQLNENLAPFEEAKALLIANEHPLELALLNFVTTRLGIPTERDEIFAEDFWLMDGS